jgi:hypothetical protein
VLVVLRKNWNLSDCLSFFVFLVDDLGDVQFSQHRAVCRLKSFTTKGFSM